MKKLFCFISFIILVLSLASCNSNLKKVSFKSYGNEVEASEFFESFNKAVEENEITGSAEQGFDMELNNFFERFKNEFDFEYTLEQFSNEEIVKDYAKPAGKSVSTKYSYDLIKNKVDYDNSVRYEEKVSKDEQNENDIKSLSEENNKAYYTVLNGKAIKINPKYSSYSESNLTSFSSGAGYLVNEIIDFKKSINNFGMDQGDTVKCEVYVKNNVFTAVKTETQIEEDGDYSHESTVCFKYQLILKDNHVEYLYEHSSSVIVKDKYSTTTTTQTSGKVLKIDKKNVNLKAPSIEKYALN